MLKYLATTAALLTAACGSPIKFQQNTVDSTIDAGETHLAVLSVTPWNDIAEKMKPEFSTDTEAMLSAALPRVSGYQEKLLFAFAASLGLNLPVSSFAEKKEFDADGNQISGSRTEERVSGADPGIATPGSPLANDAQKITGDLDASQGILGASDPFLKYQTASALKQYVTMLNEMVATVPQAENHTPYLVTFQITSFPYAVHQPYDVYLDMSFYPQGTSASKYFTPIVVPVLMTDNVQGEAVSRAAEQIVQLSVAMKAAAGGAFGSLGATSDSRRAGAVVGTDYTSTFTIGKTAENGLTAVLGAARNPYSGYSMIRRTHNVSVLLLVPNEIARSFTQFGNALQRRIGVMMTTSLRRPDKVGPPLPLLGKGKKNGSAQRVINRATDLGVSLGQCANGTNISKLFDYVVTSYYPGFSSYLSKNCGKTSNPEVIYHVFADVLSTSPGVRGTTILLPPANG